ncbi:hypothetical protein [Brunnivagina elsteri]|uniref:Uncharacterized protein n=1 Tax=Brunnivagina elsteri CCALA 953 TaxID=987040 RepID=A0A2A2TFA3_9CYAN|nr:hypothetical protein [Calothrix elsteri]PAX52371.1 hypothetical protein CK510_19700 [Calothrix elsteri CCALA 953]
MPDIFVVDSGDANSMQQYYEQVIEVLLRALLDAKLDNSKQGLKIFDDNKLVYGQDSNYVKDEISGLSGQLLNPQLITQLQQLRSTPVGEVVEGAINKRVELDGKVVLHSNEDGRVIVNELLEQEVIRDVKQEQVKELSNLETRNGSDKIIYPEFPAIENNQIKNTKTQVPGSTRVAESLKVLEDSPLKALLSAEVEQLQSEIKALQQERNLYQELIQQRLQQPQNTSWWQELKNKASIVITSFTSAVKIGISEYQANSTQHQFAASIKNLFHLQTQARDSQYQASDYQISRNGSLYEIKESATNKQIMQFRSTPLGLKVEKSNLESNHINDFTTLQTSLQQNETVPASFAPVGNQEAEYFARVDKITSALLGYAAKQQKDVTIDGVFSYKWQANPDGNVIIEAKDGRGKLLEKAGGKVTSNMSDRDLVYFEQIIPKLQASMKKEAANSLKLTNYQER